MTIENWLLVIAMGLGFVSGAATTHLAWVLLLRRAVRQGKADAVSALPTEGA